MTLKNTPARGSVCYCGRFAAYSAAAAQISWEASPDAAYRRAIRIVLCFRCVVSALCATTRSVSHHRCEAPNRDTSYIDANGTAHVTRVVPVPQTVSPEAQKSISRAEPDQGPPQPLEERRKMTDAYTARARVEWTKLCPNTIVEDKIAGVPGPHRHAGRHAGKNKDKVLLNLHGGGFNSDSGSYTESIPIASYTGIKVVAVLYRLVARSQIPRGGRRFHRRLQGTAEDLQTRATSSSTEHRPAPSSPPKWRRRSSNSACRCRRHSASSAAWATLHAPAIPWPCMRCAACPGISIRRNPARTIRSTWLRPIPKTRSSRLSTVTCTACRPPSLSPAAAICC